MALAKWMGFGPGSTPSVAPRGPSVDAAKVGAITRSCKANRKQFGLENFGNTCYVNSVLQALYFCYPFRELVVRIIDRSQPSPSPDSFAPSITPSSPGNPRTKATRKNSFADRPKAADTLTTNSGSSTNGAPVSIMPPSMFSALRSLFLHIANNTLDKGTVAPRAFVDKLKKENELFRSSAHQDAHEFLIFLLNKIAEDLEEEGRVARSGNSSGEDLTTSVVSAGPSSHGSGSSTSTLVQDLFEGVLTSETRCLTCETVSARDEAFLDLSIDIEQNSSVTACLKQFSASEMLCQKNKFFCDSCCGLQEAEKRMKIKRLPNVLALHLKRFKYQEDVGRYTKLAYRVAFPLELRLFNTVDDAQDPDRLYELFAIVVHIGNGPHHGHYVAIVKSNGSWLLFDDDTVEPMKEADISRYFGDSNHGSAYVLYYQAVDMNLEALGLKEESAARNSVSDINSLQAPAFPPGLTHEGDSDASEFTPGTPASPAISKPTIVASPPAPLNVSIPEPEPSIPITASTPVASSPNTKGFFGSIRHSPSKHSFSSSSRPLATPSEAVPPLPLSLAASHMTSVPSEASTSGTSHAPFPSGDKLKLKEKSSGWFSNRRRSARPATAHGDEGIRERRSSLGFGSGTASSATISRLSQRPPPLLDPQLSQCLPEPSQSLQAPEASPYASKPVSRPLPNIPGSPPPSATHHRSSSIQVHHSPVSKKSEPDLSSRSPTSPTSPTKTRTSRAMKRPSTAGATVSPSKESSNRQNISPSVPALPSDIRSAPPIPAARPRPPTSSFDPSVPKEDREHRRASANVTSSTPNPTFSPAAPLKRASRKLSLTAGMFSFVRRDKEKDKEKEKEKHQQLNNRYSHTNRTLNGNAPQTTYGPHSAPGMSLNGR